MITTEQQQKIWEWAGFRLAPNTPSQDANEIWCTPDGDAQRILPPCDAENFEKWILPKLLRFDVTKTVLEHYQVLVSGGWLGRYGEALADSLTDACYAAVIDLTVG